MANAFFKNRRVYLLTLVAYMGSFLFGYDTGVMGSVLELESFKNDFGMAASSTGFKNGRNAEISSNVVSLLTAGCFFGALAAPWLNERLGRRYSLMIFSLIFMVGAAVQTGASHAIGTIYGGRVIAGLGIGELATEGLSWKECLKPGYRERFGLAFCIMFWQQWSGTNSIGYYAPQIFSSVGLTGGNTSLFATGIYGTVKVIATGIFLIVGIERFGRKWPLVAGVWFMAACMFIIGALLVSFPPDPNASSVSSPSIAMVVMIYLYVIAYSASFGPVPWVYVAEIFPTRLRAYGVGMASATQWLFNFVVTKVTPAAINSIGWRTFIMFGCFCTAAGLFVLVFLKETTGRSLEEMDILFGAVTPEQRKKDVELAVAEEYKADPHAEHVDRVEKQQVFKDRDVK
ncbi:general substrate transporter, partial [Aureobasidium melanogenum]